MTISVTLFADKKQQENSYEAQREDIMVNGEITTTVISLSGRVLRISSDGSRNKFSEDP